MLFHCFGMNHGKSLSGSIRQRSPAQFAVVRLELLEDRFLLSGDSAGDLSGLRPTADRSALALIGRFSQATGEYAPASQKGNVSHGDNVG